MVIGCGGLGDGEAMTKGFEAGCRRQNRGRNTDRDGGWDRDGETRLLVLRQG